MRVVRGLGRFLLLLIGVSTGAAIASVLAAFTMRGRLPDRSQPGDNNLDLVAILDSRELRSTADAFEGGRVICWNSGTVLDLRGAHLDPAGADLVVWTVFGGTRIVVPEDWHVDAHGLAVFGGAGSAAPPPQDDDGGPVLRIRHRTIFGGLGVVAEPDDELLAV